MVLKTLPKKLILMSGCSGSGMLELVSAALVDAINNMVLEKDSLKMEVARFCSRDSRDICFSARLFGSCWFCDLCV